MLQPSGEGDPLHCDLMAQLQTDRQPQDGQQSQGELAADEGVDGAGREGEVQTGIHRFLATQGSTAY